MKLKYLYSIAASGWIVAIAIFIAMIQINVNADSIPTRIVQYPSNETTLQNVSLNSSYSGYDIEKVYYQGQYFFVLTNNSGQPIGFIKQ